MKKKIRISVFLTFAVIFVLVLVNTKGVGLSQPVQGPDRQAVQELHQLARQKKAAGCDISAVIDLERQAKAAFRSGKKDEGTALINQALEAVKALQPAAGQNVSQPPPQPADPGKRITVNLEIPAKEVLCTVAVPKYEYVRGNQIRDFEAAFDTRMMKTENGRLTVELDDRPVFLEVPLSRPGKTPGGGDASPFGFLGIAKYSPEVSDLNIRWSRLSGGPGLVWALIEPEKGRFDFTRLDASTLNLYQNGINLMVTTNCFNPWDQYGPGASPDKKQKKVVKLPRNLDAYSKFLQAAAERYDGDGVDDAPGSPVVRYWQVQNELDMFWDDTPENYAKLLKVSYKAIKNANPNARVVMGGIAHKKGFDFYAQVIRHLSEVRDRPNERYFDAFDLHWATTAKSYAQEERDGKVNDLEEFIASFQGIFSKYGYADVPVFITEMSTYSGCPAPKGDITLGCQTEEEQAVGLFKLFVYSLGLGVKKVFWVSLFEGHGFGGNIGGYFDNTGLIHNPQNNGLTGKKLAYYTYKLLVQKTEGVDWNTLQKIETGSDKVLLYKATKNGNPFYMLWWDTL